MSKEIVAKQKEFVAIINEGLSEMSWEARTYLRISLFRLMYPKTYSLLRGFYWGFFVGCVAYTISYYLQAK